MKRLLRFTSTLVLVLIVSNAFCQKKMKGVYVGYEQNPFCYSKDCIINHPRKYTQSEGKWYYKVTIKFTDSLILINKIPVKFTDLKNKKELVDSTKGGYYSYTAKYSNYKNSIYPNFKECKYCYRSATAVMKYVYSDYSFKKRGNKLILSNESEKNIIFRKIKSENVW